MFILFICFLYKSIGIIFISQKPNSPLRVFTGKLLRSVAESGAPAWGLPTIHC